MVSRSGQREDYAVYCGPLIDSDGQGGNSGDDRSSVIIGLQFQNVVGTYEF